MPPRSFVFARLGQMSQCFVGDPWREYTARIIVPLTGLSYPPQGLPPPLTTIKYTHRRDELFNAPSRLDLVMERYLGTALWADWKLSLRVDTAVRCGRFLGHNDVLEP